MPVAAIVGLKKIVLLQLNGVLKPEEFPKALSMAWEGLRKIYEMERNVLGSKYKGV